MIRYSSSFSVTSLPEYLRSVPSETDHQPWAPEVDPLRERAAAMILAKKEREQLLALEAAKGEEPAVIDVKKENDTEVDAETLESVVPPPEQFDGRGGR